MEDDKLLQQFIGCIEGQFSAPADPGTTAATGNNAAEGEGRSHGEPLAQFREEVADDEGMALSPAEVAEGLGESQPVAAAPVAAAPAPRHTSGAATTRPAASRAASDDSIDLGATVLPVLLKSYAPHAIGALLAIALGYLIGRRRR